MPYPGYEEDTFGFSPRRALMLSAAAVGGFLVLFAAARLLSAHAWYGPLFASPAGAPIADAFVAALVVSVLLAAWLLARMVRVGRSWRAWEREGLNRLHTRRQFDAILAAELERSARVDRPLAVVRFDIERLGAIARRDGWDVHGEVVRHAMLALLRGVRVYDSVCQMSPNAFAVILPDTTAEQAAFPASRVTRLFEEAVGSRATLRSGVASFEIGMTAQALLDAADPAAARIAEPATR